MEERRYTFEELYLADIIKVEDFIYVHMERNGNRPFIGGKVLDNGKNNFFVKEGDDFVHVTSGRKMAVMSYPCGLGDVGISEAIKPLSQKIDVAWLGIDTKEVTFSLEEVIALQRKLAEKGDHKMSLTDGVEEFLNASERENG